MECFVEPFILCLLSIVTTHQCCLAWFQVSFLVHFHSSLQNIPAAAVSPVLYHCLNIVSHTKETRNSPASLKASRRPWLSLTHWARGWCHFCPLFIQLLNKGSTHLSIQRLFMPLLTTITVHYRFC